MERWQHGDHDAAEELSSTLKPLLHRQLSMKLRGFDWLDLEEVSQIAWLRVIRNKDSYDRKKGPVKAWCWTIAFHTALNYQKQEARKKEIIAECARRWTSDASSGEDALEQQEQFAALRKCLEQLESEQRELALLHSQFGLRETARQLDVAATTLDYRVKAVLSDLQSCMERQGF